MEKLDKDNYEEILEKYAVSLFDSVAIGTGFLYAHRESKYICIFTTLHVVLNALTKIGNNLTIDWNGNQVVCSASEIGYCTLYDELDWGNLTNKTEEEIRNIIIKIDGQIRKNQDAERNKDVAVLHIPKSKFSLDRVFERKIYCMEEKSLLELKKEFSFFGVGFPNGKDFALGLRGKNKNWISERKLRACQAIEMDVDFDKRMQGFSGTGLVTYCRGEYILTGLVASCNIEEKNQCFYAVGTSEIISKMKQEGWETPNMFGKEVSPKGFLIEVSEFQEDLKDMYPLVKKDLMDAFMHIKKKCVPKGLAQKETFYEIPKCPSTRIACPIYWKGRFWVIYICKFVYGLDFGKYDIKIKDQKLRIEYICTEGSGNAEISTVVASAIRENILGLQIKGNCILVWQSKEMPGSRIFPKRKLKNIVKNIASGSADGRYSGLEEAGYDLLEGEMKKKNYGIFHIKYLLEQLERCQEIKAVNKKVREVLEDVWE